MLKFYLKQIEIPERGVRHFDLADRHRPAEKMHRMAASVRPVTALTPADVII
jgi:hypothetical protein